jgi:hypothetical protein
LLSLIQAGQSICLEGTVSVSDICFFFLVTSSLVSYYLTVSIPILDGTSWLNDLWKFDIDSHRWTCIQESSDPRPADETNMAIGNYDGEVAGGGEVPGVRGRVPSRRFGYISVVHDNKLVLFGGFDGTSW